MSYFQKINNAELWKKIQKLRDYIKILNEHKTFKERNCWACGKNLNIFDFLSDNLEFTPEYVLKLWQTNVLEFHCCECYKNLKIHELKLIKNMGLETRYCQNCNTPLDIYKFSKIYNFLKLKELKEIWLNENAIIFCSGYCEKYYYKIKKRKGN